MSVPGYEQEGRKALRPSCSAIQLEIIFSGLRAATNNKTHTTNKINTSRAAITP